MADKHRAAPAKDCKSRIMLTLASGIFGATGPVRSQHAESRSLRSARRRSPAASDRRQHRRRRRRVHHAQARDSEAGKCCSIAFRRCIEIPPCKSGITQISEIYLTRFEPDVSPMFLVSSIQPATKPTRMPAPSATRTAPSASPPLSIQSRYSSATYSPGRHLVCADFAGSRTDDWTFRHEMLFRIRI
jgi:hypothetical protein